RSGPIPAEFSLRSIAAYSAPFAAGVAVDLTCTSAERFGLARAATLASTALFVQSVGLARAAVGASTSFLASYNFPIAAQAAHSSGAGPTVRRHLFHSALALGALALFGALFAGRLTALFFGRKYAGTEPLLPWAIGGACFAALGQAFAIVPYV